MNQKVSVIIPFHKNENQRYLDLCLESLANQSYQNVDVIVSYSSQEQPTNSTAKEVKMVRTHKQHFSGKINDGVDAASAATAYIIIGNDDTIYSKSAIEELVSTSTKYGDQFIMNPMSNCDNNRIFLTDMGDLKIQMNYEEVTSDMKELVMDGFYSNGDNLLIPVPQVCMYATFMHIYFWRKHGPLDENFRTGFEDADFCVKANLGGIRTFICMNSFVFHFSGKSTIDMRPEDRKHNQDYFYDKWAKVKNNTIERV